MKVSSPRRATTRRGLLLENLENRALMAGDVSVAVSELGVLVIRGDEAANGVHIRQLVEPPAEAGGRPVVKWAVGGTEAGGEATTINGGESPFVTSGPIRTVVMEMGAGDDVVGIANPRPEVAEGEEAPPARPVLLPGNPVLALGQGNDTLRANITNGGFLKIAMGAGNDDVNLGGSQLNAVGVLGDAPRPRGEEGQPAPSAETPEYAVGNDRFAWQNSAARGPVSIQMLGGNDRVAIVGRSAFGGPVAINLGGGDDGLKIGNEAVEGATTPPPAIAFGQGLAVAGGIGNDQIGLHHVGAKRINIDAQGGNDHVVLARVTATDGIFAALGAGNDKLSIGGLRTPKAALNGGEGDEDLLANAGNNQVRDLLIVNFEKREEITPA